MDSIGFLVATIAFFAAAGALTWFSFRREGLEGNLLFHGGGLLGGGSLGLASLLAADGREVWVAIVGLLLFLPFVLRALACVRSPGDADGAGEARSYDRAEAFEKRRQWDRAVRLYRESIAADPTDVEARLRIVEIESRRGRFEEAVRMCREAMEHQENPRQRATTCFRMAELEVEAGHPERARAALEDYLARETDERMVRYARSRLEAL